MVLCFDSCMHYCITVDVRKLFGAFFILLFQEKTNLCIYVCTPCTHCLKLAQKNEKADVQSTLGRKSLLEDKT